MKIETEKSILSEFESFDKLELGTLVIDYPKRRSIFSNRHFKSLAGENESLIIDNILFHLDSRKRVGVCSDMKIDARTVFGYTVYKLSGTRYLVFLSDISYKNIYFENREENYFYDRLSRLIAEVAHEMGNPLSSVTTALHVLNDSMDTWSIEKKKEYLHRAIDEIERLSLYLAKMCDFSRGTDHIDIKSVSLRDLTHRVIEHNKEKIDSKKIGVTCDVGPALRVEADEYVLFKVLSDLFYNSIDILPDSGAGEIRVFVEEANESFVKLVYRDNSPPIPPEEMEKMFMPFFASPKRGPGIDLAVSAKLMTRMGGKMEAENPYDGRGPRFILYVPVSPDN